MVTTCVLVTHLDDGTTVTRVWPVAGTQIEQIGAYLGAPAVQQMLTAEQARQVDAVADRAVTL